MDVRDLPVAHACFQLEADRSLSVPAGIADYTAWHYLSHCILRKHRDLHNHTKRVSLCHKVTMHAFLPGALHDLFVALGRIGYELQTRIFIASQTFMIRKHIEFFQVWLIDKSRPAADIDIFPGALLSVAADDIVPDGKLITTANVKLESFPIEQQIEQLISSANLHGASKLLDNTGNSNLTLALKTQLRKQIKQEETTLLAFQTLSSQLGYSSNSAPGSLSVVDSAQVTKRD